VPPSSLPKNTLIKMTILANYEISFNEMASLQLKEKNVIFMPDSNKLEQNYELFCQSNLMEKDSDHVEEVENSPDTYNNPYDFSNERVTSKYSKTNTKQSNKKEGKESC